MCWQANEKAERMLAVQVRSAVAPCSILAVGPDGHFVAVKEIMALSDAAALARLSRYQNIIHDKGDKACEKR